MRKITFLFCVLMIVPTLTLANSDMVSVSELRQQAEAMGRWTKTYEAHGRTIEVDVPIIVPEVEEFPVFLVEPYYAVYEQRLTRDGTMLEKIGEDGRCSVYAESNLLSEEGIIGKARVLDLDDFEQVVFDANYSSPIDEHNLNTKYTSEFFYPYEIEQVYTYAEDNPASLEDAVTNLEKIIGYFYPEEPAVMVDRVELRSRLHKVKGIDDYNLGDYVEDYPSGTYNLSICQTIQGIPVYHDVGRRLDTTGNAPHELIDDAWEKSEPIMRISDNRFEFMGDDSFEMLVRWVKEVGITKEDVPLAPLSSIISSIEDEIQKGHIRNVYALRLGYGCYITNESPETYVLYPTWICDCDYIGDPKEKINVSAYNIEKDFNKKYSFKTLVINAQTGEMDDPYLSKKEQIFCPTIITWEDAQ